jgi:hypothetical protein
MPDRSSKGYRILEIHPLVGKHLFAGAHKDYIEPEYNPNGNLQHYVISNRATFTDEQMKHSARQTIIEVLHIHIKRRSTSWRLA